MRKALVDAAATAGVDPKSEMYKLPAMYVGGYAERGCRINFRII
jgi:hypothetical protein